MPLQFLEGGGEMGRLIREKDWSKSTLGSPLRWPQSLRTSLSIILNSKFPMFLFWGVDLICFYNDAYRPSLGKEGKHPDMLGGKGEDHWKEIWHIIKPLIDQVLAGGEATWSEDQLIPIYRNGKIEDVYWTFSYSPVTGESGKPSGVFVTCSETTSKVVVQKRLEETERKLRLIIVQAPVAIGVFQGKNYVTEIANSRALELWGRKEAEVMHRPILEAMPELQSQGIKKLLDGVYATGNRFSAAEFPIRLMRSNQIETAYINFSFEPLYGFEGKIDGIMAVGIEVTQQVMVNKKIEASEIKLGIVINASELGTWELNLQTGVVSYSDRYIEILGWKKGTILTHQQILKHLHPDDLPIREAAFKEAISNGILHYQSRIIWNNGSIHWIEGKGKVFYNENNAPINLLGTLRDITDEKNYEKKLKASEKKFRLLADSVPQHIWTADTEGKLNYFNESVLHYSGMSTEKLQADGWIEIVHPDDREKNINLWIESISTGKDFFYEHRFRKYTGEYRWQLSRAIPQKDENGIIRMWVGTSTDIQEQKNFSEVLEKQVKERTTELVQLNESLKKSEERYHLMVEEVQDYAILYLNREGIVENWNTGAAKIKGYKASEIIGKSFSNFYTEEDRKNQLPFTLLSRATQNGKAVQEGWRVRKDGTLFWASVVITAVHNEQKEVIGFSKVTHDLTAKKAADDALKEKRIELEQKNSELEKINNELKSFTYISSHDLQEPLRKIQTFASLLLQNEYMNLSDTGKIQFKRMQNSAQRMQTLIADLLAYSRTNTGDRVFEVVELSEIIREVEDDLKEELQEKQAQIQVKGSSPIRVIPFQFRQLLQNLVTNSLKFSSPGRLPIIKIDCKIEKQLDHKKEALDPDKDYFHITISDNGIGFDQQYSEKIFELFQRLHNKAEYEGTGIGLAIVKKIVENHDGYISATSAPNKGVSFNIYLPVKD
jgi:PAS domain S-box-containing protein